MQKKDKPEDHGPDTEDHAKAADLFRAAMQDVAPLQAKQRAVLRKDDTGSLVKAAARRQALAQPAPALDPNPFQLTEVPQLQPYDVLAWKKTGVQEAVFRKLRQGRYPVEDSLDLHRHSVRQARTALFAFLQQALARGQRMVLVLHGRGERGATPARIKSHVAFWLPQHPDVIALHSAQRQQGGTGALYVLLRKPEAARADNAERHGGRGPA